MTEEIATISFYNEGQGREFMPVASYLSHDLPVQPQVSHVLNRNVVERLGCADLLAGALKWV